MVNVLTKKKLTGSVANAGRASGAVGMMTERGRGHHGTGICGKNNKTLLNSSEATYIYSSVAPKAAGPSHPFRRSPIEASLGCQ